jgi:hypothetical protein
MTQHLAQLALNELGAVVEPLAQLDAQLVDLALHEQIRRIVALFLLKRLKPSQEKPTEKSQAEKGNKNNDKRV